MREERAWLRYITQPEHIVELPDDLFEQIGEVHYGRVNVHFKLRVGADGTVGSTMEVLRNKFSLYDSKKPLPDPTEIWQEPIVKSDDTSGATGATSADATGETQSQLKLAVLYKAVKDWDSSLVAEQTQCLNSFFARQQAFEEEMDGWEVYADIFYKLHKRRPVLYDLYCGGGGYSRGARLQGVDCYGFDVKNACKADYERDPSETPMGSLQYVLIQV